MSEASQSTTAALEGVQQAIAENVAAWNITAKSVAAPKVPTLQDNVNQVMKYLRDLEKKMGYQLRPTITNRTAGTINLSKQMVPESVDADGYYVPAHEEMLPNGTGTTASVEILTSLTTVTHKTVNGQDIQSAQDAPRLVVEAGGVRLKTYGPATYKISDLMTVAQALDAVTPAKYKEPATASAKSQLETEAEQMLEGLAILQAALGTAPGETGPRVQFNVAADKDPQRVRIQTNILGAEDVVVRQGVSFAYGQGINDTQAGTVAQVLQDVGYKAAKQFKVGGPKTGR